MQDKRSSEAGKAVVEEGAKAVGIAGTFDGAGDDDDEEPKVKDLPFVKNFDVLMSFAM